MAYVITTKRLGCVWPDCGCDASPVDPRLCGQWGDESKQAVATLEEARTAVIDVVRASIKEQPARANAWDVARTLPESGGTIFLPDGTVIEVRPIPERELREAVRPLLAERGPEYDADDWLTMPLDGILGIWEALGWLGDPEEGERCDP